MSLSQPNKIILETLKNFIQAVNLWERTCHQIHGANVIYLTTQVLASFIFDIKPTINSYSWETYVILSFENGRNVNWSSNEWMRDSNAIREWEKKPPNAIKEPMMLPKIFHFFKKWIISKSPSRRFENNVKTLFVFWNFIRIVDSKHNI